MENTRKATETEQEVLNFLNDLRSSAITNMFGAVPYIKNAFPDVPSKEVKDLLLLWMSNFNEEGNYKTVKL